MADQKSSMPAPSAGLSILVLVMFANLFARQMSPNRLSGTAVPNANPSGLQQTPSQLWRDPLGVTYAATIDLATKDYSGGFRKDFFPTAPIGAERVANCLLNGGTLSEGNAPPSPPVDPSEARLLMVMVPGSPFPESQETRLQTRYAVATALSVNGFVPEDSGDLGICSLEPDASDPDRTHALVPFEFFKNRGSRVLVAWVDENQLRDRPLPKLRRLANAFAKGNDQRRPRCTVIGPTDSDLLSSLLGDCEKDCCDRLPFNIISPWATVSGAQNLAIGKNIEFKSTIGSDDELVKLLAEELKRRLPRYFMEEPSGLLSYADWFLQLVSFVRPFESMADDARMLDIALVYEGESSYGRQWCEQLENALDCVKPGSALPLRRQSARVTISNSMQYFRGIEGIEAQDSHPDGNQLPKSSGSSQLDYVRRLSLQLEGRRLSAIGILGAQVEDKLAIIHELRPMFPDAIFFTTDLDARLLPQTAGRDTMNLIVASQYGLESPDPPGSRKRSDRSNARNLLSSSANEHFPAATSFRSAYQVSTYLAVCTALGRPSTSPSRPCVYEIGRTLAHPLLTSANRGRESTGSSARARSVDPGSGVIGEEETPSSSDPTSISPDGRSESDDEEDPALRPWLLRSRENTIGIVVALVILALCVAAHPGWLPEARRVWADHRKSHRLWAFVAVGLVAMVAHVAYLFALCAHLNSSERGQQFFVTEGISPWPTMFLHAIGTIVSVVGFMFSILRLIDSHAEVKKDELEFKGSHIDDQTKESIRVSFSEFRRRIGWRSLTGWVTGLVVAYYVITGFMFKQIGNEIPPTRGIDVLVADRWYLFWAIIPFIAVLFLALCVSHATHQLLEKLRSDVSKWLRSRTEPAAARDSGRACDAIALAAMDVTRHVTKSAASMIWGPAASLALLFVSRSTLFTRWTWPPALIVTFLACALLILIMSSYVRSSAHRLRSELVQILSRIRATSCNPEEDRLIHNTISYMTTEKSGAFAPLLDHPIVQAGLLPILGLVLSSALDLLPKYLGAS